MIPQSGLSRIRIPGNPAIPRYKSPGCPGCPAAYISRVSRLSRGINFQVSRLPCGINFQVSGPPRGKYLPGVLIAHKIIHNKKDRAGHRMYPCTSFGLRGLLFILKFFQLFSCSPIK